MRHIIWNTQGLITVMFGGIVETKSQGWILIVATRVTDTPFMLAFLANFKNNHINKNRHHIGDMETLLSLIT